ncbi:MAG: CoA transferase [Dehalococcoidia bacterium]|nr:CoA transferase [Dehalococcoidia bacterium]
MTGEAFSGLRVLDLTRGIAGPYCTRWFAEFGAEVTKIEPPGAGDPSRAAGPFPGDLPDPEASGLFLYLNARKKSVTANIASGTGSEIVRRLASESDLFVEDFGPGGLAPHALGVGHLRSNPRLIYVSISNFGHTGPYRDLPATDLTLAAASGTMSDRVLAGREPLKMGGSQSLYIAGRVAFISAMAALLHRDLTGAGQWLDLSAMEAAAVNDLALPTTYAYQGVVHQPRRRPAVRGRGGLGRYPCRDGWVDVMPGVGGMKKLATLLGDPELASHPWFEDHAERAQHAKEFDDQFMDPWFAQHDGREIVERAQALGMPFSYTSGIGELFEDPQLAARNTLPLVDQAHAGSHRMPGPAAALSLTPAQPGRAPLLGEHNAEILGGRLGFTPSELALLRAQGVV